eukprot:55485_1
MGVLNSVDHFFKDKADALEWILFEIFCVIYCFCAIAIVCSEYLNPALETLCIRWDVRDDIAMATFIAFGTVTPQIVINAIITLKSQINTSDNKISLSISIIIGIGMLVFSLIPAICCYFSVLPLKVKRTTLSKDVCVYLLGLLVLFIAFYDGKIVLYESILLVSLYIIYLLITIIYLKTTCTLWGKKHFSAHALIEKDQAMLPHSFVHKARIDAAMNPNSFENMNTYSINNNTVNRSLSEPVKMKINSSNDPAMNPDDRNNNDDEKNELILPLLPDENEALSDASSSNSDDEPKSLIGKISGWITLPLHLLFKFTCPPSGEGEKCECLYGITICIAIIYVTIFSFILLSVISAWIDKSEMCNQLLFGILLIPIGLGIQTVIESVAMSKKGYGYIVFKYGQSTQVISIGIGLGLPWLLSNLFGNNVEIFDIEQLQIVTYFQIFIVSIYFIMLAGLAFIQQKNIAELQRWKAIVLICVYFCAVIAFTLYLYL